MFVYRCIYVCATYVYMCLYECSDVPMTWSIYIIDVASLTERSPWKTLANLYCLGLVQLLI